MTLEDLQNIQLYQTQGIAAACKEDIETLGYIMDCVERFYKGDWGDIPAEDTESNNKDLQAGYGHILARYAAKYELRDDVYIEAHIDKDEPGNLDANNTLVMYCGER